MMQSASPKARDGAMHDQDRPSFIAQGQKDDRLQGDDIVFCVAHPKGGGAQPFQTAPRP